MAETSIGAFKPETARLVLETVTYLQQAGFLPKRGQKTPRNYQGTPLYFRNDSGEEVPRYGCVQVVGTVEIEGQNYFKVEKPKDATGQNGPYLYNLHVAVPAGEYGIATAGPEVRTKSDEANPDAGLRLGPQKDSFFVAKGEGLNAAGPDDIDDDVIRAITESAGASCIRATLDDCLYRSDITGTATPLTDEPDPEPITFRNNLRLDGLKDSRIVICRYPKLEAEPDDNQDGQVWLIEHVASYKARHIKISLIGGSQWSLIDYYDGEDPTPCGMDVVCEFDCSCLEAGAVAYALYDPNADVYRIYATDSAVMGTPENISPLLATSGQFGDSPYFNGCTLVVNKQTIKGFPCGNSVSQVSAPLPTGTINSIDQIYGSGSSICVSYTAYTVVACSVGAANADCVDVCPVICECPETCEPPECNCGDCYFENGPNGLNMSIEVPGGGQDSVSTGRFLPNVSDTCCWTAVFGTGDDQKFMEVCYKAGDWVVSGTWPGDETVGDVTFMGTGDCTGASLTCAGGLTPCSGTVTADGQVCTPPPGVCCNFDSETADIANMDATNGDYEVHYNPGSAVFSTGGGIGCALSVDFNVTISDSVTGDSCTSTAHAELMYDHNINGDPAQNDCRWHVNWDACTDGATELPAGGGIVATCVGGLCSGATGTCEGGWNDLDFSVVGITGPCVDPDA